MTELDILEIAERDRAAMNPHYCVDGQEFANRESDMLGDGNFPPFRIFDSRTQSYLPNEYSTRQDAESASMNLSLLSVPRPPSQKPTCSYCGSDDVRADAFAAWNVDLQQWEVSDTYDKDGCCEGCGQSDIRFTWVPA